MREIRTRWEGPQAQSLYTVMYFTDVEFTVAEQRAAIGALWTAVKVQLSNQYSYTVETEGRVLDDTTGGLTGSWADPTAQTGTGTVATQPVPDSSQMLLRWNTGVVYQGRFLKGRTFVPGLSRDGLADGNLNPTATASMTTAANNFATAEKGFGVWSRPTSTRSGIILPVASGSCWSEIAVQRGRRG